MYDVELYGALVKRWLVPETRVCAFWANEICTKDQNRAGMPTSTLRITAGFAMAQSPQLY